MTKYIFLNTPIAEDNLNKLLTSFEFVLSSTYSTDFKNYDWNIRRWNDVQSHLRTLSTHKKNTCAYNFFASSHTHFRHLADGRNLTCLNVITLKWSLQHGSTGKKKYVWNKNSECNFGQGTRSRYPSWWLSPLKISDVSQENLSFYLNSKIHFLGNRKIFYNYFRKILGHLEKAPNLLA